MIEVRTQQELDQALHDHPGELIACIGTGVFYASGSATVRASDSATVRASGSATVYAYGSATVRASGSATVYASGSATVRAYDSATVRASSSATVYASGSATVRASGSATVRAYDSATVRAGRYVPVQKMTDGPTITGGVLIERPTIETPEQWCDYHGVEIVDGVATLYKGVGDVWVSSRGMSYEPGSTPEAPDWDPVPECGGGLHFSPTPMHASHFTDGPRWVACPVRVDEIVVHPAGDYPSKVKAPRVVAPGCYEVTLGGERVA